MAKNKRASNEVFGKSSSIPTSDVMKDEFGFEIPVEVVPLPSGGVIYPEKSSLHGKNSVEVKAMTAREEDILTSKALIKKGTVITHLIKSCLIDKSVDVRNMISGDRNALMVALRVTGYGQEYKVDVDCPACSVRSNQAFDLAELPIKSLEIAPVEVGTNVFSFDLPITKKTCEFRFLTGKDEEEIMVMTERKKKTGLSDNLVTTRLTYSIVSIDGVTDRSKIAGFIRNMPARDSLSLRRFIDKHEPGIEMKAWMECGSCFTDSEVRLPLGAGFFWPDA
jgi:hypothetical protein|tara:strand:- start:4944 stop:5780 length:837 start_codon:yes stop_codon:yes gene_type:complete